MKDQNKTKKQLLEELEVLHNQLVRVKKAETNRKRVGEALQTTNERLNYLLTSTSAAIYTSKTSGDYGATSITENVKQMMGYEPREFIENSSFWIGHVHPEDRQRLLNELPRIFEQESYIYEYRFLHKDGNYRWVCDDMKLIKDEFGSPIEIIGYWTDITERKQTEAALKESEQRFRTIFEGAVDGILLADIETKKFRVGNKMICRMLGYSLKEVKNLGVMDIHPKEALPFVMEQFDRLARGEITETSELPVKRKDCSVFYAEISTVLLKLDAGTYLMGTFRDITERKQAEEALRESEERFRFAFENANTGVCLVDLEGNLIRVNSKMCEIFGYTREELERMTVNDIAHPEDIDKSPEFIQKTLQGEIDRGTFEKRYFHKKGHVVTCEVSSSLVRNAEGSPLYFISHIHDITERKKAEELLQKEREISLSILENAPYGVALIDKGGAYIYTNPEFTNITGYTLQDVPTGKDWFQKAFPDPKDRERMIEVWKEDRSKGNMINREFSINSKDGKINEIDIRSTFLRDGRAVIVLHDITEKRRAEEEMKSLQEQLRQSQKMEAIGRLAGGIAHDFNNLLTIIKGYSQLSLIELSEDNPLKRNIEHIHTATDRAADLVRQLLAFSRRQILEMKVLDLNTTLANLHNMLRRLIGEDIELTTVLAEDLGRVKTDLGWIEQAIMNLVVNARDAMPSGGKLTIETRNADLDEAYVGGHVGVKPGRYVMLSVSDTGVGMTPEVRERLFEPFFSTKEKDKGTGLGLSTVYGIVKQSGGDIWVYSEPGKGSTFKIYLPRVDEPLEQPREKVLGYELLRGSETILLVEDEEEVRKLAVRVLERQGYKVLAARDGDEALLICERHQDPIHLMLTDVVMPGMNGHELAERLEPLHPRMKVLYMSGYTDNAIVLHGVLVEGVNYIQKPFTVDALTKKVREVLEQ
jgi:two-component system cell cycle sensor histidine kinase/response regulator CckA